MRCQLVHGAATYSGKLNRTSLKRCVVMMQRLLPSLLLVWIEHSADEDWGPMAYTLAYAGPILSFSASAASGYLAGFAVKFGRERRSATARSWPAVASTPSAPSCSPAGGFSRRDGGVASPVSTGHSYVRGA